MDPNWEIMEVDYDQLPAALQNIPNLAPFLKPNVEPAIPASISLFKQVPELIKLPPVRRQQTTEPTCPVEIPQPAASESDPADSGACAPSIAGFDDLYPVDNDFVFLPAADIERVLCNLADPTLSSYVPSLPEVTEANHIQLICMQPSPLALDPTPTTRARQDTITLVPDADGPNETRSPTSSHCNLDEELDRMIIDELLDDVDKESSRDHCDHNTAMVPLTCSSSSSSSTSTLKERHYDLSAQHILVVHQAMAQDVPHAKKKPMLHEFLGYILFRDDPELLTLRGSVYFCNENGDHMVLRQPGHYFRVADFQVVSEVWRLIKCNSSKDCTKNMKRAMRMSTTNDRNYFVNLTQSKHRSQIFKFGERSMEFFRRIFPACFK